MVTQATNRTAARRSGPLAVAFLLGALSPSPSRAGAPVAPMLLHVPPAEAQTAADLALTAEIEAAWAVERPVVRYRRIGGTEWKEAPLLRSSAGGYSATIPGAEVLPPGVEYYVAATVSGADERARFASAERPHPVVVRADAEVLRVQERIRRRGGRRWQLSANGENVNFGRREQPDGYYRLEADFTYRLFLRLESLRFGFGNWLGNLPPSQGSDLSLPSGSGIRYGFGEISLLLSEYVGVKGKLIFGGNKQGFQVGTGGLLRIGPDPGTHVELAADVFGGIGFSTVFRLHWNTVPGFPMAAGIELTNYPRPDARIAVRMIGEVLHPFTDHFAVSVRAGYQARDSGSGGGTVGAGFVVF